MPHYARAPLIEAVIDFRVKLPESVTLADISNLGSSLSPQYVFGGKINRGMAMVELKENIGDSEVNSSFEQRGFKYQTPEEPNRQIAQLSLDGFAFSQMPQYQTWEALREAAFNLWIKYEASFGPLQIHRAALRYINRIDIPGSTDDPNELISHEEYLNFFPRIPQGYRYQSLSGFLVQAQIPQEDLKCMLVINSTITQPPVPNTLSIILDFDLYREGFTWPDSSSAWEFLEKLRVRKNDVFEASITDKTRETIR